MKIRIFFLIILIVFISELSIYPEVDIFGYYENRFYLIFDNSIKTDNANKVNIGDYNRIRLKFKAVPAKKVDVNLALDLYDFHGIIQSPFGVNNGTGAAVSKDNTKIDIDRAYTNIHFKKADLTIGKQRVAIGVSYIWAPLDIFNRVNLMEPKEEKPGVNGVKIFVPIGNNTDITGVFSPEDNFRSSKSGARFHTMLSNIDLGLTYIYDGNDLKSVFGIDLRGENFIGWWLEGGYFVPDTKSYFRLALGFDYTFPVGTGIYWLTEYFYDSGGEKNIEEYNYEILGHGERFTLGRNYIFSMLRYGFSDFTNFSISYIGNIDDESFFINPSLGYNLFQNVTLSTGFYFPMGKQGEFKRIEGMIFYLWIKINF